MHNAGMEMGGRKRQREMDFTDIGCFFGQQMGRNGRRGLSSADEGREMTMVGEEGKGGGRYGREGKVFPELGK